MVWLLFPVTVLFPFPRTVSASGQHALPALNQASRATPPGVSGEHNDTLTNATATPSYQEANDVYAQNRNRQNGNGLREPAQDTNEDSGDAAHELYLDVSIDGVPTGAIMRFIAQGDRLFASRSDLRDIGIDAGAMNESMADHQAAINASMPKDAGARTQTHGHADADADVALDTLPGVRYRYVAAALGINLTLDNALRQPVLLDPRGMLAAPLPASSLHGFVLNYDAYAQTTHTWPRTHFALWNELRFFAPSGVFSQSGLIDNHHDHTRYIRYDTSWRHSRPSDLTTLQLGDTISSSLAWSRSIRIGGIQYRRNFALRPDLITFPIPSLRGASVVPSAVDLYINDVRQFSAQVPTGPFVLNQVPGINGAGQATVVTRDALGRSVATTVPLYVDTRLLAPGLSSYSFEAGFVRRRYGIESFDYDRRPAFSHSSQYGVSSLMTVSSHTELTSGLLNAGGGLLFGLGTAGVLNGSLSASIGRLTGQQFSLGYQFISPAFSLDAQTVRATARYGDLAARDHEAVPTITDRATFSLPFFSQQSLALSYIGFKLARTPRSHIASLSYLLNAGRLVSFNVSVFRDFGDAASTGLFVGMNVGLGGTRNNTSANTTTISTSVSRQDGQTLYNVNASRPPDYAGGLGWAVQAGRGGAVPYRQGQVQFIGRAGEVTALASDVGGHASGAVDVSGAVVFMDGSLLLSRRIDDSFAVVSTDGVPDIPVLHENRMIGKTNRAGRFLVPDLNAYQHNHIGIDPSALPANVQVTRTSLDLVPRERSGVLGHFGLPRYDAATVVLRQADGTPVPEGTFLQHRESGVASVVGFDGIAFIERLKPDNHLHVGARASRNGMLPCTVTFTYRRPDDGSLPVYGPLTCAPASPPRGQK